MPEKRSECNLFHHVPFLFFPLVKQLIQEGYFLCSLCSKTSFKFALGVAAGGIEAQAAAEWCQTFSADIWCLIFLLLSGRVGWWAPSWAAASTSLGILTQRPPKQWFSVACTHFLRCEEELCHCKSGEGWRCWPWAECSRVALPRMLCLGAGQQLESRDRNLCSLTRAGVYHGSSSLQACLRTSSLSCWGTSLPLGCLRRGGSACKPAEAILHLQRKQHHYHPSPGPWNHSCRCSWPGNAPFYIQRAAVADSVKSEDD